MKKLSKDYEIKKARMQKKLSNYCKINNLEIKNLTLEQVEEFMSNNIRTINRSAFYQSVKVLNLVLSENDNEITISSKDYSNEYSVVKDEMYFTKKEVQDICNQLFNYQDKAIVYLLFNGVMGKGYKDLLNIKVKDIAEDYSYIIVNGKKIMCDDYLKLILEGTVEQMTYYKIVHSGGLRTSDYYDFNESSEYLIKVKPTKTNCYGLNPMTQSALNRKLTKLQDLYEEKRGEKIVLSGTSLVVSGIMFDMFLKSVEDGKTWEIDTIDNILKMNGIKKNAAELYRRFWLRYYDSKKAVF
ncbi:hypothetical protein [Peptostreptococcus porci]|uniref:phage lytic cycle repressor MrpR family protein n=1 Tax=Peptostreptococcus porci TaxID=2652282 RepID=UPI002A8005E2|nr:hypothetical protein [Peptostreptococcus porci]MDY4127595.1 hypothetical protein [Peptostreptococcus porci]